MIVRKIMYLNPITMLGDGVDDLDYRGRTLRGLAKTTAYFAEFLAPTALTQKITGNNEYVVAAFMISLLALYASYRLDEKYGNHKKV